MSRDSCIRWDCQHDRAVHVLDFEKVGEEWVETAVEPGAGDCLTCWQSEGLECRFADEPSERQLEAMYSSDGPSARETYLRDWQQHQELHR